MAKMKYQYIHECPKPSMIIGTETVTFGKWWWKEVHVLNKYDTRNVVWTCDCGAEWNWRASFDGCRGYWSCNYRPEVWKDIK